MVKVIIVNGRPGVGKSTFETKCLTFKWNDYVTNKDKIIVDIISTVDFVKKIAVECGWDGKKTLKNRKFLSDLKDLLSEWNDVPYKEVKEKIEYYALKKETVYLFIDSREPEEIERFKKEFNATTVLVRRLGDEIETTSNHADANVFNYNYDYIVKNYGSLEDLELEVIKFLDFMKERDCFEFCN